MSGSTRAILLGVLFSFQPSSDQGMPDRLLGTAFRNKTQTQKTNPRDNHFHRSK
jgi:hypothetical protein